MARADASKHPLRGEDIQRFLRSFEGAAATFAQNEESWTLWLPEVAAGDHPLTPSSQVFFPVILRNGQQAFAIRFLYDCSIGKVRYYTSAIPQEIVTLPEFENAISELFRHSLPVEPVRERKLGRGNAGNGKAARKAEKPATRPSEASSLAEPEPDLEPMPAAKAFIVPPADAEPVSEPQAETEPQAEPEPKEKVEPMPEPLAPQALVPAKPAPKPAAAPPTTLVPVAKPEPPPVQTMVVPKPVAPLVTYAEPPSPPPPQEVRQSVRFEIGPRAKNVLTTLIWAMAIVIVIAAGIYAYLQATEDPGVMHHRLQIEEMRMRQGR